MAEPVDYFMQGVGLGQRSRSIRNQEDQFRAGLELRQKAMRNQEDQFRTNLAERARQFDLNNDIAQSNLALRQKELTLSQENAVIEQQYRIANTERIKAANNQAKKLADDAVKFAPNMSAFNDELNLWDGVSAPPKIPSGLPLAQRKEAAAMRNDAINASNADELVKMKRDWNTQQTKLYNEGFAWTMQNNVGGMMYNAETNETYYDFPSYLKMREAQMRIRNTQRAVSLRGMTPSSATYVDQASGIQTTFKPQAQPISADAFKRDWLSKNITKFISEDGGFDKEGYDAVLNELFGEPIDPDDVTNPSQINPDLLSGELGTTP